MLAIARIGHAQTAGPADGGLDAPAREVLAAVVPVILDGALPADSESRAPRVAATIDRIRRSVAGLPPHMQAEVGELFALLAFAPGRRLIAGVRAPWREATPEDIAAFLERWRHSGWTLLRQGYLALHELVLAAFYADPGSWPRIDYPGPPRLG